MVDWMFYPRSTPAPPVARDVIDAFNAKHELFASDTHTLPSNAVLAHVRGELEARGFLVESGKKRDDKIFVPVLFGRGGAVEKSFEADAVDFSRRMVLEVEAGRGVINNQFLKDLFQACMMQDIDYLGIAVRLLYTGGNTRSHDFERVIGFFDTLYASNRLQLPLKGILLIGY